MCEQEINEKSLVIPDKTKVVIITPEEYNNLNNEIIELKNEIADLNKTSPNIINLLMKIQNIKVELQKKDLKKSGFNSFSKFSYYILEDFLPSVNDLCLKFKVFLKEDYEHLKDGYASMTAIDCEDFKNQYTIKIPSAPVDIKGGNAIQNIASQITYSRRHMYLVLLGIVEAETVDATNGSENKEDKPVKGKKEPKAPVEKDRKLTMKELCTSLSSNGHKDAVMEVLQRVANVKNPNSIQDTDKIEQIIKELEAL